MPKTMVIYHADCPDGFTAAYAAWKVLGDDAHYVPASYGEPPPDVAGFDVYIVDFCYPADVLLNMDAQANKLVVLDHHASWVARVSGLQLKAGSALLLDVERSGAGLAWDYFHPGAPRPFLVACVEDRDLWRFVVPNSAAFLMHLDTLPRTFATWETVANYSDESLQRFIELGQAMEVKFAQLCQDCADRAMPIEVAGVKGFATCASGDLVSYVGGLLARKGGTFGLCWYIDSSRQLKLSFRSVDSGIAKQLAETLGGGGHPDAAAVRLPFDRLTSLLSNAL